MEIDKETLAVLKAFNRNCDWLKLQSIKNAPAEKWGSYEDASKILPRSKTWFKVRRNGVGLIPGKDWRRIGGRQVEYRIESIEQLKKSITR